MISKIIFIASSNEQLGDLIDRHTLEAIHASIIADGRVVCAAYPRHHHTRFALSDEVGVVVFPGVHDPAPIGDLHQHLVHIGAKSDHTMREAALRLHAAHGPVFHPDT